MDVKTQIPFIMEVVVGMRGEFTTASNKSYFLREGLVNRTLTLVLYYVLTYSQVG